MSYSFGPIDSFAQFFDALQASIAFARSPDSFYAPLQPAMLEELLAIHAWTAKGRTPLLVERTSVGLGYTLHRARENMPDEPPDEKERMELAVYVTKVFREWPESDDYLRRGHYTATVSYPRVPTQAQIAVIAQHIEDALIPIRSSAIWPLAPAFKSKQPMMRDTMTIPQWARWVLLPRLRDIVQGTLTPPVTSQIAQMARSLAQHEETWPLLYALGELDDAFIAPLPPHLSPLVLEPA